ncbi:MAG: hypothetical protein HY269_07920 [Deltaproteobacteria bacterium]|nr:hypothetical protein [Deltaproteobacteria bacterium]
MEEEFALKQPVAVSKRRAIPWKSSSYDSIPVAELRALYRATQTELDPYAKRWNTKLQTAATAGDVTTLELFALSDYLTQRFHWPSWPLWARQATRLYGAAAKFRDGLNDAAAILPEADAAVISNLRADLGDAIFLSDWTVGQELQWRDAVVTALSVPTLDHGPYDIG